jgi:hypothetical protein
MFAVFPFRDQREVMLWRVDLNLCFATDFLEPPFCLVTGFHLGTTPVAALFAGELDEPKGELSPISP